MRKNTKFLFILMALSMMLLIGAQGAFAEVSAYSRVYFKILNPDDFGIPIEWALYFPGPPVYDKDSEMNWYYNDEEGYYNWDVPENKKLARNRNLWSKVIAPDLWGMNAKTFALQKGAKKARSSAEVTGKIQNNTGEFIAQQTGWMTIKLEYILHARLNAGARALEGAGASGRLDFMFSNYDSGKDDNLSVQFDVELKDSLEEQYFQKGTVTLSLYFKKGQMGDLNWIFDNLCDVETFSIAPPILHPPVIE